MKKIKRILIVTGGIWIPAINMAGTIAIFNHIKTIGSNKSIKIDVDYKIKIPDQCTNKKLIFVQSFDNSWLS